MTLQAPIPFRESLSLPPGVRAPRLHLPRVVGVRPGSPVSIHIGLTGGGDIRLTALDLPDWLTLNESQRRLEGMCPDHAACEIEVIADSEYGRDLRPLRVIVGNNIALTPPMGWNSWNCWGKNVSDAKIRAAADWMVKSGLREHGWSYINIDDGWQGVRDAKTGALQPNEKFPDMAGLCDYVHALGLKIGIYSTPWKTSYAGFTGGSADNADGTNNAPADTSIAAPDAAKFGKYCFAEHDVKQWVEWGIDYLKYDWYPLDVENTRVMSNVLRRCGRDIVYSLSNSADIAIAPQLAELCQLWRTTGDIIDLWKTPENAKNWEHSVTEIGFSQHAWSPLAQAGRWNDADMLVIGQLGWSENPRPSRLTPDEQRSHVSLWCLLASPLLLGCDLSQIDPFTTSLLTNDEVLAVNQDQLGVQGYRKIEAATHQVWCKPLSDGSMAVGIFNTADEQQAIELRWGDIGLPEDCQVRDLWGKRDLERFRGGFEATVRPHGVVLIQVAVD